MGPAHHPHSLIRIQHPDHAIGIFAHTRYIPALGICHAGFQAYQGIDNVIVADCLHHDYQIGCVYPDDEGARFTANGLTFDFLNPGKTAHITYRSVDGRCRVDVRAEAITPLVARGHVIPGEELHTGQEPGGSEQFMHYTGGLNLDGRTYAVDCNAARDRSWRQVRAEILEANSHLPIMWTPVYFGPDLAFNQVGFAAPESNPLWLDAHHIPDGVPHASLRVGQRRRRSPRRPARAPPTPRIAPADIRATEDAYRCRGRNRQGTHVPR